MGLIRKLLFFLNKRQKIATIFLTIMIFIGALLETLGVSAIIPIAQMMMSPESIYEEQYVVWIAEHFNLNGTQAIFMFMLGAMMTIYVVKNLYLLLLSYVQAKFVNNNRARTQAKLLEWYLNRPYEYFLYADVSEILRIIRSDIQNVFAILLNLMQILTEILVILCIGVLLFVTDWKMTLFIALLVIVITLVVMKGLKNQIGALGRKDQGYVAVLTKWILQSMTGIKIVKVTQREDYFDEHYREDADAQARMNTRYAVLSTVPKLLLETVFICGILLYLMLCMSNGADIVQLGAVISAFAVAAFRVLPSVSRVNTYLANLAYYEPSLTTIYNMVKEKGYQDVFGGTQKTEEKRENVQPFTIKDKIELKGVTFAYPNTEKKILNLADMELPIGSSVGIKGPSGAGKTTVIDVLLGLLEIQEGVLLCDGADISKHKPEWLSHIGYIPQSVYLTDDSIKMNIAFGLNEQDIDEERVWEVLREAQMEGFVRELPEGIHTAVGEQGVRISGGQKQRLGIARALYHNPEILIFDEATSALDNNTETAIMDAIEQFKGRKTMIIIAHRLRTIEQCDIIYEVNNGRIVRER
ncbi:MAG: ABC transporter ATP-binding protein [Lachnospiraceae bacterium]|nr:ABC transporter ATP-binding protein [Lachnospiraceae bacterium]